MSGILTPGYLRWDGTKYVLDHDIEIVGPPGSAGPAGPIGPAGPVGPGGSGSGDLLGTYPGPMSVVGLTGISGVVNFGGSIANPTISQTTTGGTNGQPLTIRGQNAGLFGGNVVLQTGTGATAGIIQFVVGLNQAAYIDSNSSFRTGPGATSSVNGPQGSYPLAGVDFFYGNNPTGSTWMDLFAGASNQRAGVGVFNYAAGGASTNGVSIQAPGSTFGTSAYQSNGVIEQTGPTTSALVFGKNQGNGSGQAVSGRIFQSGAWGIGDYFGNNTSASAQAGLTGTVINLAGVSGGALTGGSQQATIFNALAPPFFNSNGLLTLQGSAGVNLVVGTTITAGVITNKFVTNLGRNVKVRVTTTNPTNVTASDEIISVGTVSANATTIAALSSGQTLPFSNITLNVASNTGFASTGTLLVVSSTGLQTVTYTGTSGSTQFTGCTTTGTGTLSTGNMVTSVFVINLPAGPNTGDTYTVKDANGSANASPIQVNGNGVNIDGQASSLINTNYTQATFVYNGTTWISSLGDNLIPNGYSSVVNVPSGATAVVYGFDQLILCDPTSAGCTVNAPGSPTSNQRFTVKDATAQAAPLRPITVSGNSRTIEDPGNPGFYAASITMIAAGRSATWAYDSTRNRFTAV